MIRWGVVALALVIACRGSRSSGERDAPTPSAAVMPSAPRDAAVDAPDGPALVLPSVTQRPGTSAIVRHETHLDFDLDLGGLRAETRTRQIKRKKVEIVRIDADGTVHKRMTYLERKIDLRVDGKPQKTPTPLTGKSFLVSWKHGTLEVRRADGKAATTAELDAVRAEEGQLQSPEFLASHLAGLRLVQDVPFDVPVATMRLLITGDFLARKLVLTYRGKQGDHERIDVQASLANETEATGWFVDLEAKLVIDHTGWCLEADISAQARAELNGTVLGRGTGGGTLRATPLR